MHRFHDHRSKRTDHRSKRAHARDLTPTLRRSALLASIGSLLGCAGLAAGQTTRTWVPPTTPDSSNQFWDIGARWSPVGVPLISDSVVFSSTGLYEIHLDAAVATPSIVNFTNSSGSPIFRRVGTTGSDATLTIQGTATYSSSGTTSVIGESETRRLTLRHLGTTTMSTRNMQLASHAGAEFNTLNIGSGALASSLTAQATTSSIIATTINVGATGGNRASIDLNGTAQISNLRLASAASELSASGRFGIVNASLSQILVANNLNSDASLNIDPDATVSTSASVLVGFASSTAGRGSIYSVGNATLQGLTVFGNGSVEIAGGTFSVANSGLVNRGLIRLVGGTFSFVSNNTPTSGGPIGTFDFVSGTVRRTSASAATNARIDAGSIGWIFGNQPQVITSSRRVELANTLTLVEPLQIDGGYLQLSNISNTNLLDFRSGEIRFNGSTSIGLTGAFGSFVDLKPNSTISTQVGTLTVASNATVIVRDGASLRPDGAMFISGVVALDGIAARIAPRTGSVNINLGATLRGQGIVGSDALTSTSNSGIIELNSSDLRFTGTLLNNASGIIQGRGQLNAPLIFNEGRLNLSGGFTDIFGLFDNAATGRIVVSGGGVLSMFGTVTHPAGADFRTGTGSRTVFLAPVSGAGSFSGTGLVQFESTYSPGSSPGLINFAGDLELIDPARLNIELAGTTRGSQYDALNVSGSASLGGMLNLELISGYNPAYGTLHRIISANALNGRFDQVLGFALDPNRRLAVRYNAGNVDVIAALPGDADINGTVNFNDLLALARNYNQSNRTWTEGDFDYDNIVGFTDLLALARNYGQSVSTAELDIITQNLTPDQATSFAADWALATSLVPEPTTLALLALPALFLNRRVGNSNRAR